MAGDLLDDKEELPRALDRLLMELDDVTQREKSLWGIQQFLGADLRACQWRILAFRAGGCAVLGEIEEPAISDEPEGLSAAASNVHPTTRLRSAPTTSRDLPRRSACLRGCSAASGSVDTDEKSVCDVGYQREAYRQ